MSNYNETFDAIKSILDSAELNPQERVSIVSMVRNELSVPATIWSPEDFSGFFESPRRQISAWEDFNPDVTEAEWAQLEGHAGNY